MKKEDLILEEISSGQSVINGIRMRNNIINEGDLVLTHATQKQVDPIKLAKFLSKFVSIKSEDLIE